MAALKVQRPFRCLLGLMGNTGKDASQGQRGGKKKKESLVKKDTLQTMETSPCQFFFLILRFVFCFFPRYLRTQFIVALLF